VLFKKYIAQELTEADDDIVVVVDSNWQDSRNRGRNADFVVCSEEHSRKSFYNTVTVKSFRPAQGEAVHGEWTGIVKFSKKGAGVVRDKLAALAAEPQTLASLKMPDLLQRLVQDGHAVRVIYTTGHWLDVDSVEDVLMGAQF